MKVMRPERSLTQGGLVYENAASFFAGWSLELSQPPMSSQRAVTWSKPAGRDWMYSQVTVSMACWGVIAMFISSIV